jgi:hypothetical protein
MYNNLHSNNYLLKVIDYVFLSLYFKICYSLSAFTNQHHLHLLISYHLVDYLTKLVALEPPIYLM